MNATEMSPAQLAGQKLMVGFEGSEFSEDVADLIASLHLGGIILFTGNIVSPEQIGWLCERLQQHAASCGLPPLFIAIDQEGGEVARLKEPFTEFPGNAAMQSEKDAEGFGRVVAYELGSIGVNMNMAPVMDVAFDPDTSIMTRRSFGADPEQVGRMGQAVIRQLQGGGIMAVAKHFPGIGRTVLDSHLERPELPISDAELDSDLLPFQMAIEEGVSGIMLGHILYPEQDPEWPAGMSEKIARELLRDRLGFQGLVLSDDLDMGAIRKHYDIPTVIERLLAADIDITLICHRSQDMETAHTVMSQLISEDEELRNRAEQSVGRILEAKKKFRI